MAHVVRCLVLVVLVTAITAVAACEKGTPPPKARLAYHIEYPDGVSPALRAELAAETARVARRRLVEHGLRKAQVRVYRQDTLVVELRATAPQTERVDAVLRRGGKLVFAPADNDLPFMRELTRRAENDAAARAGGISAEPQSWYDDQRGRHTPAYFLIGKDRAALGTYLAAVTPAIDSAHYFALEERRPYRPAGPDDRTRRAGAGDWIVWYLARDGGLVTPEITEVTVDDDHVTGQPLIMLQFGPDAGRQFAEITTRLIGRPIAIVLDGEVMSAPIVRDRIGGGRAQITMGSGNANDVRRDAIELAEVLRAGAMPTRLQRLDFVPDL